MGIVFVYAVLGGMKGITYTQIAQYCVLILAYTIPAIFISLNLTGNPLPQLGLGSEYAPAASPAASPARQARSGGHRSRLQGVHHQVMGSTLNMFVLHPVADDRHRGPAPRHHPLLHRAQGQGRALLRRLGAGLHRHPLHHGPAVAPWRV
jgi:hypothetical protein